MSCRYLCLLALPLLPLAGVAIADDAVPAPAVAAGSDGASGAAGGAVDAGASVTPAVDAASAGQPVAVPDAGVLLNLPDDRLPLAKEPGFWQKYPPPKIHVRDLKPKVAWARFKPTKGYVGIGMMNDMLNFNAELLTDNGYFYARLGRFMNTNAGAAMNGGWRKAITTDARGDGYYAGVFAGALIGDSMNSRTYAHLGVGADMSYQITMENTLHVFSVGIGLGKHRTDANNVQFGPKPTMFFSYSLELNVF